MMRSSTNLVMRGCVELQLAATVSANPTVAANRTTKANEPNRCAITAECFRACAVAGVRACWPTFPATGKVACASGAVRSLHLCSRARLRCKDWRTSRDIHARIGHAPLQDLVLVPAHREKRC